MQTCHLSDFLNKHLTYEKRMGEKDYSPLKQGISKYIHPLKRQFNYSQEHLLIQQEIEYFYQHAGFSSLYQGEKISFFISEPHSGVGHRHPYIELMYVYAGHCVQELDGNRIEFRQGDLCLLDTSVLQQYQMTSKDAVIVNCAMWKPFFDHHFFSSFHEEDQLVHFFSEAYYKIQSSKQFIVFLSSNDRIKWCMENALCEYFDKTPYSDNNIQHYMLLLFSELSLRYDRFNHWGASDQTTDFQLSKIISFIEKNYKQITLEEVARHFNYNTSYLGRWIKNESGMGFHELVQNEKLAEAVNLLKQTDMSVEEIANAIGYSNLTYFYKLFRMTYGKTPGSFRKESVM